MARASIGTKDGTVYTGEWGTFRHNCERVGDVELSEDWRHCPWCGMGLTRRKAAIVRLDLNRVEVRE